MEKIDFFAAKEYNKDCEFTGLYIKIGAKLKEMKLWLQIEIIISFYFLLF